MWTVKLYSSYNLYVIFQGLIFFVNCAFVNKVYLLSESKVILVYSSWFLLYEAEIGKFYFLRPQAEGSKIPISAE